MQRILRLALVLGTVWAGLVGCAPRNESAFAPLEVVTVVVTSTPGPTQTPVVITEVQTVVVVATAEPSATPSASATMTATATPEATEPSAPSPTLTRTAVATATPMPTTRPAPTGTAPTTLFAFRYGAPTLLAPVDQEAFSGDVPILRWEAVVLGPDEYYEVTIERFWQDQPYYAGSDWLREPQMVVPTFVRGTSDTHQYTWWVTVKRLTGTNAAGGKIGEAISPPSQQRTFTWQPG